jgi:hypothetical protein
MFLFYLFIYLFISVVFLIGMAMLYIALSIQGFIKENE